MQSTMFTHHESYAPYPKKNSGRRSAISILLEAAREENSCSHVRNPRPPQQLFGVSPESLIAELEFIQESCKEKSGKKVRRGSQLLGASVSSIKLAPTAENLALPEVKAWIKKTHEFYKVQFGAGYKSLCLHVDEAFIHVHAYHLPSYNENMVIDLGAVHPGYAAQRRLPKNASRTHKNKAYNQAMRKFQDDYYEQVGAPCALLRHGPKRRRLTRGEWLSEKRHATVLQQLIQNYESTNATLKTKLKQVITMLKTELLSSRNNNKNKKVTFNYEK